jgi:hypothetical protein
MRYHYEPCKFNRVTLSGKPAVWLWRDTTVSTESLVPHLYNNTSKQQSHFLPSVRTQSFRHPVGFMALGVGWDSLWMWLSNGAIIHLSLW